MLPIKQDFSNVNVLVVEDNKVNQLLVVNLLKKFGFTRIDTAENGKEAFRKMDSNVYDLVLMDIQMPGMDGYETTRAIRGSAHEKQKHIPIIALTGDSSEKEKAKATDAGMDDYVVKPYSPEELYRVLSRFVQPVSNSASAIDKTVLESYTGGDQALTVQLIGIFLQQVPEAIESIGRLLPQKKWSEIYPVAHKIKSSFAVFGMEDLRSCILSIEEFSRDEVHLDEMPLLFSRFKAGCEKAVIDLSAEMDRLKGTSVH